MGQIWDKSSSSAAHPKVAVKRQGNIPDWTDGIDPLSESYPENKDYRAILKELRAILECEYGLLSHLSGCGLLTDEQVADIRAENTPFRQNDKLAELSPTVITDNTRKDKFLTSLIETGQIHIANRLILDTDMDPSDIDRPLNEKERDRIKYNTIFLMECLDLQHSLLDYLLATDSITHYHRASVEHQVPEFRRNEEFIDILKRRSLGQYRKFLGCLILSGQEHIAKALESGGVVVSLDAVVDSVLEQLIVKTFKKISSSDVKLKVLENLHIINETELIALTDGHSIRLFMLCLKLSALQNLRQEIYSGLLKSNIESFLSYLLLQNQLDNRVPVHRVYFINYCQCEDFFLNASGSKHTVASYSANLRLEKFPIAIAEIILIKSFLRMHSFLKTICPRSVEIAYESLVSVSSIWREIATKRRWFTQTLRQQLHLRNAVRVKHLCRFEAQDHVLKDVIDFHDKIIILRIGSNTMISYEGETLQKLDDLVLQMTGNIKIFDMRNIAASVVEKVNIVFAFDASNRCIWRITEEGQKLERWLDKRYILSLSATPNGQLLLLEDNPPRLSVYGQDAALQYVVHLKNDIHNPLHALQMTLENFLVSHGTTNESLHRICQVNQSGKLIRSYGGHRGCGLGQLNRPTHMTIDSESRIYVADCYNYRVLILDSNLCLDRIISTGAESSAHRPYRLHWSTPKRRLIIGLGSGRVDAYTVTKYS